VRWPRARERRWLAILETSRERWGGERRRRHIFRALAQRTGGQIVSGWSVEAVGPSLDARPRLPILRSLVPRPKLVSGEMLDLDVLALVEERSEPVAVAIYDDPIPHHDAIGLPLDPARAEALRRRRDENIRAFRWQVMPTLALGELAGLPPEKVIAGENGTDAERIRPGMWPDDPAIGFISGAAPARGIEALIEAARQIHSEIPELRLLLWLVATGGPSGAYLKDLTESVRRERWIEIGAVGRDDLSHALRQATVMCIPHPAHPYWDATLPVKIFDAFAAGRPLVITPLTETQRLVERHGVGIAASGDTADDLATAIGSLLRDEAEAKRIGAVARDVAERVYDWPIVSDRIATAILEREA
jgi:glycosyltransferase involved in cell wall biosynthesis